MDNFGNSLLIQVTDWGIGIDADDLPLVFERFTRSPRTQHIEGSGLGLAIARGFVEEFSGKIEIASPHVLGQGTRVSIFLPLESE